jgi:thiol-disulfide isomerase/thioredoxin
MRRSRALAVATLLLLGALSSCDGPADEPTADDGVDLTGDELGDTVLTGLGDGEAVDLAALRGRPVVVNFFASTCAPCVREMPALETVHQAAGDDVAFVGVAVADRPADALELVEQTSVTYDLAADPTGELFTAAGATLLPSTILLDADGEVVRRLTGELDADALVDALAEDTGVEVTL